MRSLLILLGAMCAFAQSGLLTRPDVKRAMDYIQANHEAHLAKQVQIAEIPAPTFQEAERAKFMAQEFRRVGLKDIETDQQGNVLGWRPGKSRDAIVIAAHLDISFAPGVNVKVRKDGEEGLGDLNGVRYLFGKSPHKDRLKAFISIDGSSPARIVNGGTGVKRYRVVLHGPGGHSYGNF